MQAPDQNLLLAAIDNSTDGLTLVDVCDPEQPLVYANRGFEAITGYSREESLGQNCSFLQRDDRDQPAIQQLRRALLRKQPCTVHLRNYRRDGSMFWNQLSVSPLSSASGSVTHFVGIQKDITEWMTVQHDLEHTNSELRKKKREVQHFYHTVSHEIKTPLTAIREFISLIADGIAGDTTEQQDQMLTYAIQGCDQIAALFNDLIDSARLDTGKMTLKVALEDVESIVARSIASVAADAASRNIRLDRILDPGLPRIAVDPDRVVQVVSNLLSNAVKHSENGGTVAIRARCAEFDNEFLEIEVRDCGSGIDSQHLPHVFDRLFQVRDDDCTTTGLGLGLSIAREIVALHGGQIFVESEVGVGSAFRVRLPFRLDEATREQEEVTA